MRWVLWLSTFYICEKGGIEGCLKGAVICPMSPIGWGWGGVRGRAGQDFNQRNLSVASGASTCWGPQWYSFTLDCSQGLTSPCSPHPDFLPSLSALTTVIKEELFVIASLLYLTIFFSRAGTMPVWVTTESPGPRSDSDLVDIKWKFAE